MKSKRNKKTKLTKEEFAKNLNLALILEVKPKRTRVFRKEATYISR